MRAAFLLAVLAIPFPAQLACSQFVNAQFVNAVEFPTERLPRANWERELVWLKNIGVRDVSAGEVSSALLQLLRRLEMRVWVRSPSALSEQDMAAHGGPVKWMDGSAPVPQPVVRVSASDPAALFRSRAAIASGRGTLLWADVEDTLTTQGVFQKGAVSFAGNERAGAAIVRREAALLRTWTPLLSAARRRSVSGRFPPGVQASALVSTAGLGSAVSLVNQSSKPFSGPLKIGKLRIPNAKAAPGQAVWLPLDLSLSASGLCADCAVFAPSDRIVHATAELRGIEFENGILAMEFTAPEEAEVLVRLSHRPSGPLIAGGRPREFDWDESASTARIVIPAGKAPVFDTRIGIAIEPPESSAFFTSAKSLLLGQTNRLHAQFSSAALAARSRLLAPAYFQVKAAPKSETEIDYEVTPPPGALHGERVEFALEADGVRLGHARLQLLRPASVRLADAVSLHFGAEAELPSVPPLVASTGDVRIRIRNNDSAIRNYTLDAQCEGVDLLPARTEIAVGASAEREVTLRAIGGSGVHSCNLVLGGMAPGNLTTAFRHALFKRGEAMAYRADLDADGEDEWIIENQKLRAVFSAREGGRWLEFVSKDNNWNALPAAGALRNAGSVEVTASSGREGSVQFSGKGWRRTIRLGGGDSYLAIEQDSPLPFEIPASGPSGSLMLGVARTAPNRAVYLLDRFTETQFAEAMERLMGGPVRP